MKALLALILIFTSVAGLAAVPVHGAQQLMSDSDMAAVSGKGVNCAKAWGALVTLSSLAGYTAATLPAFSAIALGGAIGVGIVIVAAC